MPLQRCEDDGQPGWKWGDAGKCYTYTAGDEVSETAARKKALAQAAAMGEFPGTGSEHRAQGPIEFRAAEVAGVNFAQRMIELIAVPYEQEAIVEWRGDLWHETFERGSFDGIEKRPNRVRVNRDHDKSRTIGKAVVFHPSRDEGLVTELRIAKTPLGDETLALADEDVLSASIEFAARMRDQVFDKVNKTRRIRRAFLDQIAMVPDPAYGGAQVLSVRHELGSPDAALPGLVDTPALDELTAWLASRRR